MLPDSVQRLKNEKHNLHPRSEPEGGDADEKKPPRPKPRGKAKAKGKAKGKRKGKEKKTKEEIIHEHKMDLLS